MTAARAERRGLLLAFGAFGSFWGAWAATLPAVRDQAGVTDGQLGLALAAVAVAALPTMPLAGRLMDRHGARRLLPPSLLLFGLVCVLPAFATSLLPLVVALLLLGATTGALDVLVNTATATWERLESRRLMAGAHGCFSLGVLVGSVSAGLARDHGAGPRMVLGVVLAVVLAVGLTQPAYRGVTAAAPQEKARARLGSVLLVLGLLTAASFLVEDAVQSWSALHLERSLDAPPWVGGLGPGLFAGAMALGRFGVQWLARPGTDALVVGAGATALTGGLLLLALAPTPVLALVGSTVAGAGVSVLAPTLFSAVGARSTPGRAGADLAAVSALGYAGFVAGPPLIGLLSSLTSLPTALALLAVVPLAVAVVGPLVLRERVAAPS
ncbi:MAG: major facilitator superfamily transporter [Frankiales bacterium]|nr:major facilitator superfamily transporter [Frankiales bacterium]